MSRFSRRQTAIVDSGAATRTTFALVPVAPPLPTEVAFVSGDAAACDTLVANATSSVMSAAPSRDRVVRSLQLVPPTRLAGVASSVPSSSAAVVAAAKPNRGT